MRGFLHPTRLGAAAALALGCSSQPLSHTDGGTGGAGGGPSGTAGRSSGAGGAAGASQGCYPGRALETGVVIVACADDSGEIALGSDDVYWRVWNSSFGTLVTAPKTGGTPRPLTDVEDRYPALAVRGNRLFWADFVLDGTGVVGSVSSNGGVLTLATGWISPYVPFSIDESHVYFGTLDGIQRVPQDGGDVELVVEELHDVDLQAVGPDLYWLDNIVSTDTGLVGGQAILRMPKTGALEPEILLSEVGQQATSMIVVGNEIFWTLFDGDVWSLDLARAGATRTLRLHDEPGTWFAFSFASDGQNLYFVREGPVTIGDQVVRMSLSESTITSLVVAPYVSAVAVDDTSIYFTGTLQAPDASISGVFRAPK